MSDNWFSDWGSSADWNSASNDNWHQTLLSVPGMAEAEQAVATRRRDRLTAPKPAISGTL